MPCCTASYLLFICLNEVKTFDYIIYFSTKIAEGKSCVSSSNCAQSLGNCLQHLFKDLS